MNHMEHIRWGELSLLISIRTFHFAFSMWVFMEPRVLRSAEWSTSKKPSRKRRIVIRNGHFCLQTRWFSPWQQLIQPIDFLLSSPSRLFSSIGVWPWQCLIYKQLVQYERIWTTNRASQSSRFLHADGTNGNLKTKTMDGCRYLLAAAHNGNQKWKP